MVCVLDLGFLVVRITLLGSLYEKNVMYMKIQLIRVLLLNAGEREYFHWKTSKHIVS